MKNKTIFYGILIVFMINLLGCEKIGIKEECAQEGESIGTCVGCVRSCCQGLKPMFHLNYSGECVEMPAPGTEGVCSYCGNGICDKQNKEDECNCAEDCG